MILNVPGYGTSFGSSRKTGEKPLLSPRVVFTVEGSPGSVLYLKTDIFHTISGQWWMQENTEEPVRVNEIPETGVFEKYKLTFMTDLYTRVPVSGKTDLSNIIRVFIQYREEPHSPRRKGFQS